MYSKNKISRFFKVVTELGYYYQFFVVINEAVLARFGRNYIYFWSCRPNNRISLRLVSNNDKKLISLPKFCPQGLRKYFASHKCRQFLAFRYE